MIEDAFDRLAERVLPALRGEIVDGDVAGYHYYPGRDRVVEWFEAAALVIVDEGLKQEDGWAYRHFLLRRATP